MEEKLATINIFHNKTQAVLGREGVFQTLQGVMLKLHGHNDGETYY